MCKYPIQKFKNAFVYKFVCKVSTFQKNFQVLFETLTNPKLNKNIDEKTCTEQENLLKGLFGHQEEIISPFVIIR